MSVGVECEIEDRGPCTVKELTVSVEGEIDRRMTEPLPDTYSPDTPFRRRLDGGETILDV